MDDYIQESAETRGVILWKNSQAERKKRDSKEGLEKHADLFVLEQNQTWKEKIQQCAV